MNINKFTQKSVEALQLCEKLANDYGNSEIDQEHLAYALVSIDESLIAGLIERMGIDLKSYKAGLESLLNKKVKVLARKSALAYKAQEEAIVVVEDFSMEAPKTKDFINIAKNLKVDDKKVLLVLPKVEKNVYLSARNLQKAEVMTASAINTYKILNADVLVIAESSLQAIDEVLTK